MQLYLAKPFKKLQVTDGVDVEFTGSKLRIFTNESLTDSYDATAGECYTVTIPEKSSSIIVEKVQLPENRGQKIAWLFCGVDEESIATSLADFLENYFDKEFTSPVGYIASELSVDDYAFIVHKDSTDKNAQITSISIWVSDTITPEKIKELLKCSANHGIELKCKKEFIESL